MAHILKPPASLAGCGSPCVFLAGSIEMGTATNWQRQSERALDDVDEHAAWELTILNPRRNDWDASWTQSIDTPEFRAQVEWELDGLERADVIAMYFAPDTKAPISLLELGLIATSGKAVVLCPEGFWRKGNVDIVCQRHNIEQAEDFAGLMHAVRARIAKVAERLA